MTPDISGVKMHNEDKLSKRVFFKRSILLSISAAIILNTLISGCNKMVKKENQNQISQKNIYWGDIHNHNAVDYARGSLERSYDIARSHLDIFCFTGHSQWHDMPIMPQDKHQKWIRGFEIMQQNWTKVKQLANDNYEPGQFVTFIGYEWHSSSYGDVCILFPGSEAELLYEKNFKEFQKFAVNQKALLIPHHPAYMQNWRGQNWEALDPKVSPVVEIFSEHGNAESDRAPFRYIRHSMGGRYTKNTLQWLWQQGVQVGVVASTDDHLGYPGAYGEGLVAVYADTLTRESIFEAIKARRTYGVNADRIELDFRLNGHWMGETIPFTAERSISVKVKGKDLVDRVEVLRNNKVIYRDHPVDRNLKKKRWDKPVLCRIEFGWGPWGDLNMTRICDWQFNVAVKNGKIVSATPCFQSGPFDENRRNKLMMLDEKSCEITSYTSRKQAYEERATNSIILEIQGSPQTELTLQLTNPCVLSIEKSLQQLTESSAVTFTDAFTSESVLIHRLVFYEHYQTEFEFTDKLGSDMTDWYYVRVMQANGSLAWSSPIWVESNK